MTECKQRRRGAELEDALLSAALAELTEHGYDALTYEAVAARAGTSRTVLYRRWPTKPELVVAALRRGGGRDHAPVPDTGSLRGDILALLAEASRARPVSIGSVLAELGGYLRESGMSPADLRASIAPDGESALDTVERRAVERGELRPGQLTPRIRSLPFDLVRSELLMTLKPVPPETIVEIVDTVFLPLVAARSVSDGETEPVG